MSEKLKLLVIPDLFPKDENDVAGVFILDYISCVKKYCEIFVLNIVLEGKKKGVEIHKNKNYTLCNYVLSTGISTKGLKEFKYWYAKTKVNAIIKENFSSPDIIHAHGAVISAGYAKKLASDCNIPYVLTLHSTPLKIISNKIKYKLSKIFIKKADCVLPVSDDLKKQLITYNYNTKRTDVIHNPVDTELFSLKKDKIITKKILFVGRLVVYKGAYRTLKAFEKIRNKFSDYELHFIGDGEDYNKIQDYVKDNNQLNNNVFLHGYKNKKQIADFMKTVDLFVFPTQRETFGLVIAEALSTGVPVITANRTAPPEFVSDKEGMLIDPDNIDEIAQAMIQVINNLDKYNPKQLHDSIHNRFGFDVFGKKLYDIYQSVIKDYHEKYKNSYCCRTFYA